MKYTRLHCFVFYLHFIALQILINVYCGHSAVLCNYLGKVVPCCHVIALLYLSLNKNLVLFPQCCVTFFYLWYQKKVLNIDICQTRLEIKLSV